MGFRLPSMVLHAKQILKRQTLLASDHQSRPLATIADVPRGHLAVCVGDIQKKRYVVPISYLSHPSFQEMLCQAEEEFGIDHPMGGLTIPCKEETFINLTSRLTA